MARRELNWYEALAWCYNEGDGWRLPTRLELIWAYEDNVDGFDTSTYWTGTESSTTFAFFVSFLDGVSAKKFKEESLFVCCVRTIEAEDMLFFNPYTITR